jgi:hypothetical protein
VHISSDREPQLEAITSCVLARAKKKWASVLGVGEAGSLVKNFAYLYSQFPQSAFSVIYEILPVPLKHASAR